MGYTAHKDGIAKLLIAKGFTQSKNIFDFKNESDQSIKKKFRITRPEIDTEGENAEFLQDRTRPEFTYSVVIGFELGQQKQTFDYEVAHNLVDTIFAHLNNPVNYTSFCIKLHVTAMTETEIDNYLEVTLTMVILDDLLHT